MVFYTVCVCVCYVKSKSYENRVDSKARVQLSPSLVELKICTSRFNQRSNFIKKK